VARPQGTDLIIVVPGFGGDAEGTRHMLAWGEDIAHLGFDVRVADYICRRGVECSRDRLSEQIDAMRPETYARVHVFAYIAGTWSTNELLEVRDIPNLTSIVYDRSPSQERAPAAVVSRIRPFVWLGKGHVVADLAKWPYPPLVAEPRPAVGILVETRVTTMIRMFKRAALKPGPFSYDPADLGEPYDDLMYTPLNHHQMYLNFHIIGPELVHFFQHGRFSDEAARERGPGDPFDRYEPPPPDGA